MEYLTNPPIMAYPDYEKPFIVHKDAWRMAWEQFSISAKMVKFESSHMHCMLSHQLKRIIISMLAN